MEEEENNIGLTAWDNLTTTTNGDYLVAGGTLLYNSYISYNASYKVDLKIPDFFLKVIKKKIPEINNIVILNSEITVDSVYEQSLKKLESVKIDLIVVLDKSVSGVKRYEEEINSLFNIVFPNFNFIKLNIIQFDSDNNKKFSEILRLFGK
jgi:hypothetical protein